MKCCYKVLTFVVLAFVLTSCSIKGSWYVPADEWSGLETREYSERYAEFVANNPEGSPDPYSDIKSDQTDLYMKQVLFYTEKSQYSISTSKKIYYDVSLKTEQDSLTRVYFDYQDVNLEYFNDGTWTRLIEINPEWYYNNTDVYLYQGEIDTCVFDLDLVLTKLVPGKYRLVVYVDYTPIYAEFELTE